MRYITRWNPYRDMALMRRNMDRLVDSFAGESEDWPKSFTWGIAMDVVENDDEFVIKASLPGVNPEDVDVTFDNDVLSIKGELQSEEEQEDARYHLRERRYGHFSRSLTLRGIDSESIKADFEAGVLTLVLPKQEEVKPRRIEIHSSKMIEGTTADIATKN